MPDRLLERFAPFGFVLLWSSSFIGARVGVRHVSPLLFVAVRLCLSAALLVLAMLVLRRSWAVLRGKWIHCAIAGVLVNTVLLDPAHVAMTQMNAAPIALIQTLNPLLTAALAWPFLGEPLRARQWLGLALGTAGVVLIVGQEAMHSTVNLDLALMTMLGVFGLVGGTLYFARHCRGVPLLEGATVQFIAAAIAGVAAAWLFETPHADWTPAAIVATGWNAVGVSLGSMALYFVMLVRGSAAHATANFYLVPGTAALMAWLFIGERLSVLTLVGLVVSSLGCWLVRRRAA
jgi:drug/metabolite transporter (DMT)-like permease